MNLLHRLGALERVARDPPERRAIESLRLGDPDRHADSQRITQINSWELPRR